MRAVVLVLLSSLSLTTAFAPITSAGMCDFLVIPGFIVEVGDGTANGTYYLVKDAPPEYVVVYEESNGMFVGGQPWKGIDLQRDRLGTPAYPILNKHDSCAITHWDFPDLLLL